jgi:sugar transferase EpsL
MVHLNLKRIIDILISLIALALLLPIFALVAFQILLMMGPPIFFCQLRPGYLGCPFKIYKFRTMSSIHETHSNLLPDSARLTPLGRFLRSTSLDELPELINVLRGEMSLVGPRPLLMQYLKLYTPEQARRHETKPGMTGLTQVMGRNALSWEQKFALDVWYVDHVSFWLDLKILGLTVWKIIKREGINQPGKATMETFLGNQGPENSIVDQRG